MRIYKFDDYVKNDENVHIDYFTRTLALKEHCHNFLEIVIIQRGIGTHTIDGKDFHMKAGSLFIIECGSTHSFTCVGEVDYYNILLPADYQHSEIPSDCGDTPVIYFSDREADTVFQILRYMSDEYTNRDQGYIEAINGYLKVLMIFISRAKRNAKGSQPLRSPDSTLPDVIDYINRHFTENLMLPQIAMRYNYNSDYFSRMFKARQGVNYSTYIYEKRMNYAVSLLKETDYSIDYIIELAGYKSRQHFYSDFKKFSGTTPKQFRLKRIKEKK